MPELLIETECPQCEYQYKVRVNTDNLRQRYTALVTCLNCKHQWNYRGVLTRRTECPKCGSTKNDLNRQQFGKWRPDALKQ